jgi:hypothetical protein
MTFLSTLTVSPSIRDSTGTLMPYSLQALLRNEHALSWPLVANFRLKKVNTASTKFYWSSPCTSRQQMVESNMSGTSTLRRWKGIPYTLTSHVRYWRLKEKHLHAHTLLVVESNSHVHTVDCENENTLTYLKIS